MGYKDARGAIRAQSSSPVGTTLVYRAASRRIEPPRAQQPDAHKGTFLSLKLTGAELAHLRAGSRLRDGRPSGGETELQNGERIGTAGVERLEVGEPGVGLGLVNVV